MLAIINKTFTATQKLEHSLLTSFASFNTFNIFNRQIICK